MNAPFILSFITPPHFSVRAVWYQRRVAVLQRLGVSAPHRHARISPASRETPIKSLSGGNQQKVIIGRWLLTNPDYLILDEPTRGIDIGTKTEIQKLVLDLADQGMAVTFISSEVEEMLRTCSRMGVLRDGKKVGEISGNELSQEGIMKAIAGGGDNE